MLLTWILSLLCYPVLPHEIPVHFDAEGTPTGWMDKSPATIFMTPFLETILFLLLLATCYLGAHLRDFRQLVSWPGSTYLSDEATEKVRAVLLPWAVALGLVGLSWLSHRHCVSLQIMQMRRHRAIAAETIFLSALFWAIMMGMSIHLFILLRRNR